MYENIRPVVAADESESFCVIEPLHFTFNSRHVPYSGRTVDTRGYRGPQTDFSSLGFATAFWEGRLNIGLMSPMCSTPLYPLLWLCNYCALHRHGMSTKTKDSGSNGLRKEAICQN